MADGYEVMLSPMPAGERVVTIALPGPGPGETVTITYRLIIVSDATVGGAPSRWISRQHREHVSRGIGNAVSGAPELPTPTLAGTGDCHAATRIGIGEQGVNRMDRRAFAKLTGGAALLGIGGAALGSLVTS